MLPVSLSASGFGIFHRGRPGYFWEKLQEAKHIGKNLLNPLCQSAPCPSPQSSFRCFFTAHLPALKCSLPKPGCCCSLSFTLPATRLCPTPPPIQGVGASASFLLLLTQSPLPAISCGQRKQFCALHLRLLPLSLSLYPLHLGEGKESSGCQDSSMERGNTEMLDNTPLFLTQHKSLPPPSVSSPFFPLDLGLQPPALTLTGNWVKATSRGILKVASG